MPEITRRRKARDLRSRVGISTQIYLVNLLSLPASARINALLRGCRRAVRGFIMAALAQIMAVLRRPSPAHLESLSGGEPAELVRLSLCELSPLQSIISMLQVFLRPSAPQVPLCTLRRPTWSPYLAESRQNWSVSLSASSHRCSLLFQCCRCFCGPALRKSRSAPFAGPPGVLIWRRAGRTGPSLSLCELSPLQSIISMLQVFLRPSAPQVPLCTAGGSLASASARISVAVSVGEPRFLPKSDLVSRRGLV